jgi:hypothetical protein
VVMIRVIQLYRGESSEKIRKTILKRFVDDTQVSIITSIIIKMIHTYKLESSQETMAKSRLSVFDGSYQQPGKHDGVHIPNMNVYRVARSE